MVNIAYPVGYPCWRICARFGCTLQIRVDIMRDDAAGVYVATSQQLRGLVCEASSIDELKEEIARSANVLLVLAFRPKPPPLHIIVPRFI